MSARYCDSVWRVCLKCFEGVFRVSKKYLEGILNGSDRFEKLSGRCLESVLTVF